MHDIDASFRERKEQAAKRRSRARRRRFAFAGGVIVFLGLAGTGIYLTADKWSFSTSGDEEAEVEVANVDDGMPDEVPIYVPAIVDLPGDPMLINIGREEGNATRVREVARPASLLQPGISDQIEVLFDTMLSSSERFMTTIPSSQEDFAFFQAQRQSALSSPAASQTGMASYADPDAGSPGASPLEGAVVNANFDPAAGWGETIEDGEEALPDFKRTKIENNTSVAYGVSELDRRKPTDDIFLRVRGSRTLDSLILENPFEPADAKAAGEALKEVLGLETLEAGNVVALRGLHGGPGSTRMKLMQISIYTEETFIGSLARDDQNGFVPGVDPWVRDDLFSYTGEEQAAAPTRQYRLLDAIYSTAARNNVPTSVIGEAIMYLSRSEDLNAFATQDDRFVLIYSKTGRDQSGAAGRVLYVAVHGSEKNMECFVYRPKNGGDFACMDGQDQQHSLTISNGMVTPVNGVMTSTFGPRKHPILKTVRVHKGVDWAAPIGSPVFAAFDGKIVFQGDGGGYGNLVRISHGGGRETRYAHLDRFAGLKNGAEVKAGDVVGYVGTTGLSTGPHLHFELYQSGTAINPLGGGTVVASSDGSAVEQLTDRIIRVESGGNASAKNPLSSATGLGQFIDSTWLRMMRTYRPDLARSLSRQEQLALRFDPTISREMVKNLAREGEAYLRARGHQITAGRLYLCHFLGMDGAATVLSSNPTAPLIDVLGAGVINANPFLTGKDVAYVISWAERKMNRHGRRAATPVVTTKQVVRTSPEFVAYRDAVTEIVEEATKLL